MSQHEQIGPHDQNEQNDKNELANVEISQNDQNEST